LTSHRVSCRVSSEETHPLVCSVYLFFLFIMINSGKLAGRTIFITGSSRGIGKAIGLKAAKDGANIIIAAKTTDPHPKLKGTIYTAAEEIEKAGGKCLPVKVDIRDESEVQEAVKAAVDKFGGLDILVNNASAISLTGTTDTTMKKYDLMNGVNARGTFMMSKYCIEHLKKSSHAHILNISPPLDMNPEWFKNNVAYTIAKFGMSMCALGMAAELAPFGIGVNALWPRTAIWTAAMEMLSAGGAKEFCRDERIMSDAAYAILCRDPKKYTANFYVDEDVLREEGIKDFDQYSMTPGAQLMADFFLPPKYTEGLLKIPTRGYRTWTRSYSDSPSGGKNDTPDKIFNEIASKINDDAKKEINAVMSFVISGNNWCVDAHSSRPFKISKEEPEKPDVTFITDEETFAKMAKGEIKATNAFMSGKLKVKGNLGIAMKAEKMFSKLRES